MRLPEEVADLLSSQALIDGNSECEVLPLTGGVSSDIWCVKQGARMWCVKRPCPQLKVAQEWTVSIERGRFEALWLQTVAEIDAELVPRLIAWQEQPPILVMEMLSPLQYANWKQRLLAGQVDSDLFERLGERLARVHNRTAFDSVLAARFATDELFFALRPNPYWGPLKQRYPQLAPSLNALDTSLLQNKKALVHGDVSPKNILLGPGQRLVMLDAECAWYGDPAFDVAFFMNHLLLKMLHLKAHREALKQALQRFKTAYFNVMDYEPAAVLQQRVEALLPVLMLARVDGKSPAEYLNRDAQDWIREHLPTLILEPDNSLERISDQITGS